MMKTTLRLADLWAKAVYARRIARGVLPRTAAELARWRRRIDAIPDAELRRQALASITHKRFHAEGGSVYAALAPAHAGTLVSLIVALQTISDYLDNLCDRSGSLDEDNFRILHQAMLDAVNGSPPGTPLGCAAPPAAAAQRGPDAGSASGAASYYARHPHKEDGGYLAALVDECRRCTAALPAYDVVRPHVLRLVELYNDLQVYKHGPHAGRVGRMEAWFAKKGAPWPGLFWWEFAAASGSTLGVFALFTAATNPALTPRDAERIVLAYFPWICGLHILLDYLIDQQEDVEGGDLNLVSFYPDRGTMRRRLVYFVQQARRAAQTLPDAAFHVSIVQGLPGLYLSDGKVRRQRLSLLAWTLLRAAGPSSFAYYAWCRRLRRAMPAP